MDEITSGRKPPIVRRVLKNIYDSAGNEKLKQNFLSVVPFWIASLITGLIAVFYSKLFLIAESTTDSLLKSSHWLLFIITPTCFLIAWWLLNWPIHAIMVR